LLGYLLPERPEPISPDLPAMFVSLQELENLAPGTWYVNVLALYPQFRGRGLGTRLLGLADRIAEDAGSGGLSIIVSDTNAGARRLYERCGYREAARRAMVKEDWENAGREWMLLMKEPAASA
jgi:ribosomal protein S18 acetylase RimI-like enzyme